MAEPAQSLWYKDAVIYQLHVRTFCDSNNDGIGDFPGLMQKLDYLQYMGVDALWLMPFFPSPLRDDGYDISDYTSVHPNYGELKDFKAFLKVAHERGIRVIIELVLNHTSDQHPWFQESRSSRDNPKRDWYVWSDTDDRYKDARIIFVDTEMSNWAWDPVSKSYYWHRFFSHQPDLNYDNPAVFEDMWGVMKFWLDVGRGRVPAGRGSLSGRAGRNQLREPARDARDSPRASQAARRGISRQDAAGRGQPVAGGRIRLFRQRR